MSAGSSGRRYRLSGRRLGLLGLLMGSGAVGLLVRFGGDPSLSSTVKFWIIFPGMVVLALFFLRATRYATITDAEKVVIRGLVRTRTIRWPDVRDIRAEVNLGGHVHRAAPTRIARLHDLAGRRIALPGVNDKNLGELDTDLDHEVEAIRQIWSRGRGAE